MHDSRSKAWWRARITLLVIALAGVGGCAQFGRMFGARPPKVTVTPAPASASSVPPAASAAQVHPAPPLHAIVVQQLEQGHFTEGRRQLHRYIRQHPDDRAARDLWKQLTADPQKLLGTKSRIHVVKPGDTYSSLAARYLGDAGQFLILARYNHASDPSLLQVGQRIRVPLDAHLQASAGRPVPSPANPGEPTAAASGGNASSPPTAAVSKAEQLQQQSLALLGQGHRQQAMNRMAQALDLDPKLKSPGGKADALRQQLLASYHQRAIVLYRDQKLSQAIGLWDKILAIDPGYEPAIIYRARARELQSRLKQL